MKLYIGDIACSGSWSPSVWREWIEMNLSWMPSATLTSPSVWREWIEMVGVETYACFLAVSLRVEGVD